MTTVSAIIFPSRETEYRGSTLSLHKKSTNKGEALQNKDAPHGKQLILREFLNFSYPSMLMCKAAFSRYILQKGGSLERMDDLFRAFDVGRKKFLSFKHFYIGLAALDPHTNHGGGSAEIRCKYIFRFYSSHKEGFLEPSEFRNMVIDIMNIKGLPCHPDSIDKTVDENIKLFHDDDKTDVHHSSIPLNNFLVAVGNLKFRGTSILFRLPRSIYTHTKRPNTEVTSQDESSKKLKLSNDGESNQTTFFPFSFAALH
eukprot:XP_014790029.1 PREDICTED: uncharacterized protein LOC106883514 [Octopus bimaculoides]